MGFVRHIIGYIAALLFAVLAAVAMPMASTASHKAEFFPLYVATTVEHTNVHFAARAPPTTVPNVAVTGDVTVMHGGAFVAHGVETLWASFNFSADLVATNNGPRFITDVAGNTLDTSATKNLTSLSPSDVNFQAGRGATTYDMTAAPNSYANLGNGHAVVYGADGRALYDVSAGRVKVIEWNQNPNTGQWFPKTNSDLKAFEGNVPQTLLDDLGLN